MIKKIIKKDKNEQLEEILAGKDIDEQAKNLLQGILYKIEASYKDYRKVKAKQEPEEKYVEKMLRNIDKNCNKIKVVKLSQKLADEELQKELKKNKFYINKNEIISYPIEEKILYAIEKNANNEKILNNKYGESAIAISNFINTGKNLDRVEVLRDFNGYSWTTINSEIENIDSNLIYQTLQIVLGEEFLENWCQDKDGIIDYLDILKDETNEKIVDLLKKISIINAFRFKKDFADMISEKIKKLDEEISEYDDTQSRIQKISEHKKQVLKEIKDIEKILCQEERLKAEFRKRNEEEISGKKFFSIKALKQEFNDKKQKLLNEIEEYNYLLNPTNYLAEKEKFIEKKKELEIVNIEEEKKDQLIIELLKNLLELFIEKIKLEKEQDEILKLIYKFRYFLFLPFDKNKDVKDVEELQKYIIKLEKVLIKKAVEAKVITLTPFEVVQHVFTSRIIVLEELHYKITLDSELGKYYVQIFDDNISEDKFEIENIENAKTGKKIKIFMYLKIKK